MSRIQFYNNQETHAASITYNSANWEFKSNTGITAYLGGMQYGQFRAAGNGKSVIHRWDGSYYYILFSDSETGGWNNLRPFTINTNGGVSFGHDVSVGGQLYLSGNYYLKCPDGKFRIIACVTSSKNFHFGSDSYDDSYGATYYSGNTLYVRARTHLYRNLSWEQGSDARLKHGVCEIPDRYLDAYMDIEPVQFLWNDKPTLGRQSGVIAQQVLEALCKNGVSNEEVNIVSMTEDTEMYGFRTYMVNYEFLNVLTMAAVQRQEKKIKELEDQLSKLKA